MKRRYKRVYKILAHEKKKYLNSKHQCFFYSLHETMAVNSEKIINLNNTAGLKSPE